MMTVFESISESGPLLRDAVRSGNLRVLASMLGPAFRGLIRHRGRNDESTPAQLDYRAPFDWRYTRSELGWSIDVDPETAERPIIPDDIMPIARHPLFLTLTTAEKGKQRGALLAW